MDGHIENLTHHETFARVLNDESVFELFSRSTLKKENNVFYESDARFHSENRQDFEKTTIIVSIIRVFAKYCNH
jgi:hypothetical protein